MKTNVAIIKLVLRTNKTLSDGTHPIMLRCSFHGMSEVSTHYSCTEKFWDKKNECVKKGYPNWVMINHQIAELKSNAIKSRNEYELKGEIYTPSMVLVKKEALSGHNNHVKSLVDSYCAEKGLKYHTKMSWGWTYNLLSEFGGKDIIVNVIDINFVKRFITFMQGKGISDGSIKFILGKVGAICNYAIAKGLMKEESYPFKDFSYSTKFPTASKLEYIHWRTLDVMKDMLLKEIIDVDDNTGLWTYKDGVLDDMMDRHSDLFARILYMEMVLFQGLAQVDLLNILKSEIEIKSINGKDYYCYDGQRRKTGKSVKIRIKCHTIYNEVMVKTYLMYNPSEWFMPVFIGYSPNNSVDKLDKKIGRVMEIITPKLKDWFREVNSEVVRRNVENKTNIPLINLKCTYYSARHAYSMMYMAKGGNPLSLATLLGRSANTLAAYVTQLSEETDLVEAVSILD